LASLNSRVRVSTRASRLRFRARTRASLRRAARLMRAARRCARNSVCASDHTMPNNNSDASKPTIKAVRSGTSAGAAVSSGPDANSNCHCRP
jgi:hypothetical protein